VLGVAIDREGDLAGRVGGFHRAAQSRALARLTKDVHRDTGPPGARGTGPDSP
jgi:hypothetical protein